MAFPWCGLIPENYVDSLSMYKFTCISDSVTWSSCIDSLAFIQSNCITYTGWSKSVCAPVDYNTESYK